VAVLGLVACGGGGSSSAPVPPIKVTFLSATTNQSSLADEPGRGDVVEFKITYEVEAIGGERYIDETCTGGGLALLPEDGNVFEIGEDVLVFSELISDGDRISGSFLIEEGTKVVFTLTVVAEARSDGFAQLVLEGIGWSTTFGEGDRMVVLSGEFRTSTVYLDYFE
jgi:hypothetical protein